MRSFLIVAVFAAGCASESFDIAIADGGTDAPSPDTAIAADSDDIPKDTSVTADTAKLDTASHDTAKTDTTLPVVDATGRCTLSSDCRKFSSYCSTAPCKCLPLGPADREPTCTGSPVSCFVDPCEGKSAECVAGECVLR